MDSKKFVLITAFVLVIVSIISVLIIYLIPRVGFLNRLWQYSFWKFPYTEYLVLNYPQMREYFGFYLPGDEKYNLYRENKYQNIVVELYLEDNPKILAEVPTITEQVFKEIFKDKTVSIKLSEKLDSSKELGFIDVYSKYNSEHENSDTRVIHLTVTTQYVADVMSPIEIPDAAGVAANSRSILIQYPTARECFPDCTDFKMWNHQLQLLGYSDSLRQNVFEDTLIHELGHILGLHHTNIKGCVMTPDTGLSDLVDSVSLYEIHKIIEGGLVFEFCDYELQKLQEIQAIPLYRTGEYLENYYYRSVEF